MDRPRDLADHERAVKTIRRIEWRGDLFALDLPPFLERLESARIVPYQLSHTLTIFLRVPDADFSTASTLRVRCYCALDDLDPESIRRAIADGLSGKLQMKALGGNTRELLEGPIRFLRPSTERDLCAWSRMQVGDKNLEPASVRVARRVHYELPSARVTVDLERSLFRIAGDTLRSLGDMGPRIEIKGSRSRDVRDALSLLNSDGTLRRLRYGSLELLFQDMLRDFIRPLSGESKPEIESKFELAAVDMPSAARAVIASLGRNPEIRLLLPVPHQVVRMRRYHFCDGEYPHAQNTIVETASGRLSAKVKRDASVRGTALIRTTEASHSTNVDGSRETVDVFARGRGWRPFDSMTKVQTKIPFALQNGHAYLISIDHCVNPQGRVLRQLELEFIGSIGMQPGVDTVCAEIQALGDRLRRDLPALLPGPTTESKFAFYSRKRSSSSKP